MPRDHEQTHLSPSLKLDENHLFEEEAAGNRILKVKLMFVFVLVDFELSFEDNW